MNPIRFIAGFMLLAVSTFSSAAEEGDLKEVQSLTLPELRGVTSIAISEDGKFLYSAAFQASTVLAFKRDLETGLLTLDDAFAGPSLAAAVRIRLSEDGNYAVTSAFAANTVTVFKRDSANGRLTVLANVAEGQKGPTGVDFVIDAMFTKDRRFVYTASSGGVGVFKFENDKLSFVQYEEGEGYLKGVRGCVISPDGKCVYAPSYESGTLGVLSRDEETGQLKVLQILKNEKDGISHLAGAFRVAASADGKHVYVSGGRFKGDQAVNAFEVQPDGKLKLLQEFVNGKGGFNEFEGGNEIKVSPDGKSVFAVASVSDRLFRFSRDPETGKLTFIASQEVGVLRKPGSAGLCFSPDGRFVYVADESGSSIVSFKVQ
jgi:6-phosphogluconolactonase (cycloisomerase 2 family)